jgi:hypothetical protein
MEYKEYFPIYIAIYGSTIAYLTWCRELIGGKPYIAHGTPPSNLLPLLVVLVFL